MTFNPQLAAKLEERLAGAELISEVVGHEEGTSKLYVNARQWTGVDIDGMVAIPWEEYYSQFYFVGSSPASKFRVLRDGKTVDVPYEELNALELGFARRFGMLT